MTALNPKRRKSTARDAAERHGVTPRTVRKYIAEPRAEYLARAKQRRAQIVELYLQGLPPAAIAERTGQTGDAVDGLLRAAREHGELSGRGYRRAELSREEQQRVAETRAKLRQAETEYRTLIRTLKERGVTARAIETAFGLSPHRVSRILDAGAS